MNLSDSIVALIRTVVPVIVTYAIAGLTGLADALEVTLDLDGVATVLNGLIAGLLVGVYYAIARWLGNRYPWIERILLGSARTPTYLPERSAEGEPAG